MSRNRLANIIIVPYERIKAATSYLSTPLLVSIPLPLIHFDRKLRLLLVYWSTFKIGNYLPIFSFYYALLCICYCFSHLIDLFPVTWLFFLYKTTRFFYLFSASRWRKANDPAVYTNFFRFVSDLHVCLHSALRLIFYDDFSLFVLQKYILHYGAWFLRIKFHDELIKKSQQAKTRPPSVNKGIEFERCDEVNQLLYIINVIPCVSSYLLREYFD